MREWMELAVELFEAKRQQNIMVVTGAGISLASGIPTFRGSDPDAVWAKDVLETGTRRFFHRDPVKSWLWYLDRFDKARHAEPNPAHYALATIEQKIRDAGGWFTLITQNVDGLHSRAGSQNVVEVHGSARHMRCSKRKCKHGEPRGLLDWDDGRFAAFRADPKHETLPRCEVCNSILRAHVLWFDESYHDHESYGLDHVRNAMYGDPEAAKIANGPPDTPTLVVFIGTSFAVTITDMIVSTCLEQSIPMVTIDPFMKETLFDPEMDLIKAKAEEFLPELVERL